MLRRNRDKKLIRDFLNIYLKKLGVSPDPEDFLFSIISDGIADPEAIRNYAIFYDYHILIKKNPIKESLYKLSEKYALSERQLQNIIYKYKQN